MTNTKATKICRGALALATLAALIVAGASAARANDGGYTWGMTVNPTPTQQSADVITAGTAFDYGHLGPNWVYVTPYMRPWDPNWAGPSCSTTRYHNGAVEGEQKIGAGAPAPYVWSLNMTGAVTWRITVTCPLPQGATGTPTIDVTFSSELPPAAPSPAASATPAPIPAKVVAAKPPAAAPRPAPAPVRPASAAPPTAAPPPAPLPQTPSPAASPVAAAGTTQPETASASAHQDPSPANSAATSPQPTFDAAGSRQAVSTKPRGGFHLTFLEALGLLIVVCIYLAARYHWGWR